MPVFYVFWCHCHKSIRSLKCFVVYKCKCCFFFKYYWLTGLTSWGFRGKTNISETWEHVVIYEFALSCICFILPLCSIIYSGKCCILYVKEKWHFILARFVEVNFLCFTCAIDSSIFKWDLGMLTSDSRTKPPLILNVQNPGEKMALRHH